MDEESYIRGEVDHMRQSPYESVTAYHRHFQDVANAVYPPPHNADQERLMLEPYKWGLSSQELVKELTLRHRPNDISAVMTLALVCCW